MVLYYNIILHYIIILYYNLMGTLSYMRSVVDRNVVTRRMIVFIVVLAELETRIIPGQADQHTLSRYHKTPLSPLQAISNRTFQLEMFSKEELFFLTTVDSHFPSVRLQYQTSLYNEQRTYGRNKNVSGTVR
jgi:hypothetical protein